MSGYDVTALGQAESRAKSPSPRADSSVMIRELLLEYSNLEFGNLLGAGGFGEVFRGRWHFNDVAIKVLSNKKFTAAALEEFRQEAAIMAKMRSDYIVQLRGYCESPSYCLVMEYMPVGSLYDVLHNDQELPWYIRLRIGLDLSYGLAQLHNVKILHRDLKSLNVLLYEAGGLLRAKLADFGLSRMKNESNSLSTASSKSVGTLAWMAPELLSLKPKYSVQSDMYSYGMVLWELAEREVPFAGAHPDVLRAEIKAGGAKEEFSQDVIDSRPQYISLAESCWSIVGKRPTATEAVKLMEGLFETEMKTLGESKPTFGSPLVGVGASSGLVSNLSSASHASSSLQSGLQDNLSSQLSNSHSAALLPSPQSLEAAKKLERLRLEAEERKLGEEETRLEAEQLEAEVRQLEEAQRLRGLAAKRAALLKQQEEEAQVRTEQEKQERGRQIAMQHQQEQEEVQRRVKEDILTREAAEKSQSEQQELIRLSWKKGIDPKSQRAYYYNRVTKCTQWKEPEGYVLEGLALEAKQEADREAAYALDSQRKELAKKASAWEDQKDVPEFLHCIAYGEQDKAEEMLKQRPGLALLKGSLKDPSGREFKQITGFQYAVWALDWHMWKMLLKYLSKETAALQFQELEEKGTARGKHFSLETLIRALNRYVQNYDGWYKAKNWDAMEMHWSQEVGGAQLMLPVHIAQEYCHPRRSFSPAPSFKEDRLERNLKLSRSQGGFYAAVHNGGKLGVTFGICRYNWVEAACMGGRHISNIYSQEDLSAVTVLWAVRQQQLAELGSTLGYRPVQVQRTK